MDHVFQTKGMVGGFQEMRSSEIHKGVCSTCGDQRAGEEWGFFCHQT